MPNTVPVPQGATLGYGDEPQPQGQAQPSGLKTVPVPQGTTFGFGDEGQTSTQSTQPPVPKSAYDQPLTSYAAATKSGFDALAEETINAGKGAAKSVWDTIATPPQDEKEHAANAFGVGGLAIYRVLRGLGHSAGDATKIAGAIHDINQSSDPVAYYLDAARRTAAQGAGQALVAAGTEGATQAAGEVAPVVKAGYKNVAGKLSVKPLQEPLQAGINDIIRQAVKDTKPEPAPEPNYVYRARDVGEAGIPKPHPTSHGQAMEDLSVAKQYAEPGQRGAVGRGNNFPGEDVPQEIVRIDLNKLKPEDYQANTAKAPTVSGAEPARGGQKYDFPNGLPEEAVEKVTPELESNEAYARTQVEPVAPESKSIRNIAEQAGDQVEGVAKADYQLLDKESGGRIQRFRDKLEANRRKLLNLTDSEEDKVTEASILKNQKATEDEMHDEFDSLRKKGISPDLLDRADANFRKSQALYDLDNAIKKSTTGAHPDSSHPDLLKEYPETVDPRKLHNRINTLHDSGRLDDALGEAGADKLFDHTLEHSGEYQKILRNQKRAWNAAKTVAILGGAGYAGHYLPGILGLTPSGH
jgi:hypothetical protein